jgi:hypothetical protein
MLLQRVSKMAARVLVEIPQGLKAALILRHLRHDTPTLKGAPVPGRALSKQPGRRRLKPPPFKADFLRRFHFPGPYSLFHAV